MTATRGDYSENEAQVFLQPLWQSSATKKHRLGTMRRLDDGREFVYAQAGAANLAAGKWCQSVVVTNAEDTVTVAHAVGTKAVTITEAGQAGGITLNQFEDGWLIVDAGAGIGEMYKIKGNPAIANAATGTIQLYDGLATLWVITTTNVHLHTNPYKAVIIGNAGLTVKPVCVPQRIVPANYYFWGQTKGWASMVIDQNSVAGGAEIDEKLLVPSPNDDGLGHVLGSPTNASLLVWGHKLGEWPLAVDMTDAEGQLVYLRL